MFIEFICALILTFSTGCFCTSDTCSPFQRNGHGKMNTDLYLQELMAIHDTVHDCVKECMMLTLCKAISYSVQQHICHLYDADSRSIDISEYRNTPGYTFYDIKDWPQDMVGKCGVRPCKWNQRCYPTNDRYYCVDIVCHDSFVKNGKIELQAPGKNMYSDTATLKCRPRYMLKNYRREMTCGADGRWTGDATCELAVSRSCGRLQRDKFNRLLPSQPYDIYTYNRDKRKTTWIRPFCLMDKAGGGWTRRFDGSVNFNRTWDEYRWGFGSASGEYWLGLEYLKDMLDYDYPQEVLIHLTFDNGTTAIELFEDFKLNSNFSYSTGVKVEANVTSEAWGVFGSENWIPFSTFDNNTSNCTGSFYGGWWFDGHQCADANLNGKYCIPGTECNNGLAYGTQSGIKESMMMIRERLFAYNFNW